MVQVHAAAVVVEDVRSLVVGVVDVAVVDQASKN